MGKTRKGIKSKKRSLKEAGEELRVSRNDEAVEERRRARRQRLTGRLLVSNVDMLRRVAGLESSTFFLAALNSRLFGGT